MESMIKKLYAADLHEAGLLEIRSIIKLREILIINDRFHPLIYELQIGNRAAAPAAWISSMDAHVDVATVLENYLLDVTKVVETSQTLDRDVIVLQCEVPGFVGRGAGKMIELEPKNTHDAKETNRRIVSRCKKQCDMMQGRRLRHSNIVKFVGIYYRANTVPAPAPTLRLVTEFLPINLTSCIELYNSERHVRLPNAISYSILHDVAKAVSYIHSQAPPIIHRNLHSNNILLDENMTAKITDLGVAKILKHVKYPTRKPGRTEFMPPEAMMEKPKYDTSIDEFAYGVVIIHIFSGEWPVPKRPPSRSDLQEGITKQVVVTEAERRLEYLEKFSKDNPLKHLAEECINNDRNRRPHADEFVKRLSEVVKQTPASDHHRSEVREAVLPRIDSVKIKPGKINCRHHCSLYKS